MKKIYLIAIFILLHSCDRIMCSDEKLSNPDKIFLTNLNGKYADFEIYPDKCLPLGYYNIRIKNDVDIDTLTLNKILDQTLEQKSLPKLVQVYDSKNNFRFILYKVQDKHMVLKPEDL